MKTLKQIADELGVSKQRVYRFVKAEKIQGAGASSYTSTPHYDEVAQSRIKSHFTQKSVSADYISETAFDTILDTLRAELEAKNEQIEYLQKSLLVAQTLHAEAVQRLTVAEEKPQGFFSRIFRPKK
jgi:predicted transcriptional regulator